MMWVVLTKRKCTKHAAASKLYKNKLVILSGASFYVSMSPRLPSYNFKHKLRGCRQIAFVALNGFCLLSKYPPHSHSLPHVSNGQYQNGLNTNQSQMKNTCLFYIAFQVLKVCVLKRFVVQSHQVLFLVVFISFYISRYHFSHIFRTSFSIIGKKDFRHKFSFLADSLKHPHPLNDQNLLKSSQKFFVDAP